MSVKIAFWGMEESCHITENMIVMSWLLAKIRPAHSIFVHRENGWQCIFSGGKDRILFADCGCGRDKKTQNSLKNADVIVAGIHDNYDDWNRNWCNNNSDNINGNRPYELRYRAGKPASGGCRKYTL